MCRQFTIVALINFNLYCMILFSYCYSLGYFNLICYSSSIITERQIRIMFNDNVDKTEWVEVFLTRFWVNAFKIAWLFSFSLKMPYENFLDIFLECLWKCIAIPFSIICLWIWRIHWCFRLSICWFHSHFADWITETA